MMMPDRELILPSGFAIVADGKIARGDYIWTPHRGWTPANRRWIGFNAVVFGPTARPMGDEGCTQERCCGSRH